MCLLILADSAATKAAELGGFFPYTLYNQSEEPADDFKEDILLLFHGFKSTMPNHDYRVLYEAFKNSHTVVGFNYAYVDVETNIRELDDLYNRFLEDHTLVILGTSLGGFWGDYFAHSVGAGGVILVNPAINPGETARRSFGEQYSEKRQEAFTITEETVTAYSSMKWSDNPRTKRLVLLTKDDEVLDYREALEHFRDAANTEVIVFEEGGHNLLLERDDVMAEIRRFVAQVRTMSADLRAADPQPDLLGLNEGLAVRYYFGEFNHIRELEVWMRRRNGQLGAPLPMLDFDMGKGEVLGSGQKDHVGTHITGYIAFDAPGTYRFRVTSNDGVRVTLGGILIYEDPEVHGARTSHPIPVLIPEASLYPLEVLYFEKTKSATLQVYWAYPGAEEFVAVPAEVFWH